MFTDRLSFCFNFSLYQRNLTHSERIYMSSLSRFFFPFSDKIIHRIHKNFNSCFQCINLFSCRSVYDGFEVTSYIRPVGLYINGELAHMKPGGYRFQWCPLPFPHHNSNYIVIVYYCSLYLIKYQVKVICILHE